MTPANLGFCLLGALLGAMIGVLPEIGPTVTIAVLLPITFFLRPLAGIIMLAGIYCGAQYGGSTTAILVNLPGEASAVVTTPAGCKMARLGRAGAALGSFFAGTVAFAIAGPTLSSFALSFGPAEDVALKVFGLLAATTHICNFASGGYGVLVFVYFAELVMFLHLQPIAQGSALPTLLDALFEGVPDASPHLLHHLYGAGALTGVYMLVDGSLWRDVAGIFDLDVIDLPARCLLEGKAAEDAAATAPWLVDMSLAEPEKTSGSPFHRKFFARHWPLGTSLLLQTNAPFAEVRQHLRRFTQLPVQDDGRVRFFRFWDPRVLHPFLTAIADDAPRLRRMMMTDAGQPLNYIIRDGEADLCLSPEARRLSDLPITPMRLSFADFDPIARARAAERRERMVDRICTSFAKELEHQPRRAVVAAVDHALRLFGGYGFRTHAHLHFFAVWTVFYGPGFEARDPAGTLQAICRSPASEAERFKAFRDRFDSFTMRAA